ncbi:unnamed protein product [Linum trigynum]|uniref:Uncharacterized protein n=1 Tax=Linum trigynum TaxID=586398 RepID=A0AAV2DV47_9ROSI
MEASELDEPKLNEDVEVVEAVDSSVGALEETVAEELREFEDDSELPEKSSSKLECGPPSPSSFPSSSITGAA